jgi:hypothetical protein
VSFDVPFVVASLCGDWSHTGSSQIDFLIKAGEASGEIIFINPTGTPWSQGMGTVTNKGTIDDVPNVAILASFDNGTKVTGKVSVLPAQQTIHYDKSFMWFRKWITQNERTVYSRGDLVYRWVIMRSGLNNAWLPMTSTYPGDLSIWIGV